ncbi:unnamed protein product, partial [Sphacelaria rigidula]
RYSPEQGTAIQDEVQKLAERGTIEPSRSAWAAACVTVRKKDGSLRLCQDFRGLNELLESYSGGLGDMQTTYSGLTGSKYFTSVDSASGFFQLEVAEEDRPFTAFRDARGHVWQYQRCRFGLTVRPATFHRPVSEALLPARGVKKWLGNILWPSATFAGHMTGLRVVLYSLLKAGLTVNFQKSQWCTQQQDFVGMTIDASGIRPSQSKIEAIAQLGEPQRVEELRLCLGKTGYLRRYIKGDSNPAAPLTDLLRDPRFASKRARRMEIPWGDQQQQAFLDLKSALMSYPILAYPDWNERFVLHSDASEFAAGVALAQEADEREWIIEYASHRWSRADEKRSASEREVVVVLWSVERFRSYLWGREFTLVTDSSALTWLFRSQNLSPKFHRWALRLMEYDMVLKWRAGREHQLPDALSR